MDKLMVIDGNEVLMQSLFASRRTGAMPLIYIFLRKLISIMKKFPVRKAILVADGRKCWRKSVYPPYKATRRGFRAKFEDIDWDYVFGAYRILLHHIHTTTAIDVFKHDELESDDWMAYFASKGFDVILFSSDSDLNQLAVYDNVQLVSLKTKNGKMKVREIENPIQERETKIQKGDVADNIPNLKSFKDKAARAEQEQINRILIDLVTLPPRIVKLMEARYSDSVSEECSIDVEKFVSIYSYKFMSEETSQIALRNGMVKEVENARSKTK